METTSMSTVAVRRAIALTIGLLGLALAMPTPTQATVSIRVTPYMTVRC